MPDNPFEDLRSRVEGLEERVRRLENDRPMEHRIEPVQPLLKPGPGLDTTSITGTLVGRSVLIVGGAYVLRALTEAEVVGNTAGAILGLVYAAFWIFAADRAMTRGARMVALFDAGTAAAIAAALIWEATTRFHILSIGVATGAAVVISLGIALVASRQQSAELALFASIMNCVTCIGLALTGADAIAPLLGVTVFGAVISFLKLPAFAGFIVAAASDTLALAVIAINAIRDPAPGAEWALIGYAALWLPSRVLGQSVLATLLGLGGAAAIVSIHSHDLKSVAGACLVIGIVAYLRNRESFAGPFAIAIATFLVLPGPAVVVVWAALAALSAAAARFLGWSALALHALFWAAASLIPGLLVARTSPVLAAVVAGSLIALAMIDRGRLMLLLIATTAFLAIAFTGTETAVVRTLVIASAAVLLSIVSDAIPEAKTVARILLVAGGVKLLAEDLRVGQAATGVVALALYGVALLIVARRRSAADVA